ncbi:uncharacterized protein EV420DRAFT_1482087 [Desarmillaria tabescens]|uniref:Uncharacterized protein n=1 Tax=Armillaria tabescens TaxID=1929756 RepID=A0AA39K5U1_ARMTA|nr:uncharacterized protein EV420DRAFT_1482087 [Desarmillaria tabescens]KAK0452788.1 hypothetical protein EV420DRAFT_1482087 [Desarmillaria tabescens]
MVPWHPLMILVSKRRGILVMRLIIDGHHVIPKDPDEWAKPILHIAADMTPSEMDELKAQCSTSVWAALVFASVRRTPVRTLNNISIGKIKNCDWDLVVIVYEKGTLVNCNMWGTRSVTRTRHDYPCKDNIEAAVAASPQRKQKCINDIDDIKILKEEIAALHCAVEDNTSMVLQTRAAFVKAVDLLHEYSVKFICD